MLTDKDTITEGHVRQYFLMVELAEAERLAVIVQAIIEVRHRYETQPKRKPRSDKGTKRAAAGLFEGAK